MTLARLEASRRAPGAAACCAHARQLLELLAKQPLLRRPLGLGPAACEPALPLGPAPMPLLQQRQGVAALICATAASAAPPPPPAPQAPKP